MWSELLPPWLCFFSPSIGFCTFLLPSSSVPRALFFSLTQFSFPPAHSVTTLYLVPAALQFSVCWRRMLCLKHWSFLLDNQNSPISRWCANIWGKQLSHKREGAADHCTLWLQGERKYTPGPRGAIWINPLVISRQKELAGTEMPPILQRLNSTSKP